MRDNNREVRIRGIVEPFDEVAQEGRERNLKRDLFLFDIRTRNVSSDSTHFVLLTDFVEIA